ncbi:hypothetical protein AAVH_17665 [Aphelenchoides avenae]|nr:hypothetical protein AAVH_17665 [Aphelenchus avenae]
MNSRLIFVTLAFFLVELARAADQAPGPFGPAFEKLSPEQKDALKKIFEDQSLTKGQLKQKMEEFTKKLPADLQSAINKAKEDGEKQLASVDEKAAKLSAGAKALVSKIQVVLKDENITRQQEGEKLKSILDGADKALVKELTGAGIPLPLGPAQPPK